MDEWVHGVRGISDHLCVVVSETLKCFTQNLFHPVGKLGFPDSPVVKSQIISDLAFFKSSLR